MERDPENLVEDWFSTATKNIHPVFPAYLKAGENKSEHGPDGWYWSTSTERKGLLKSLSQVRYDRTKAADQNLETDPNGTL
jgi:hypothetical protein